MSPAPEFIAPDESRVEDFEEGLEVEKTERHYAHALGRLGAKCDGPNVKGQVVGVSGSVPVDELTDRGDTDPNSSVSNAEGTTIPRSIYNTRSANMNPTENLLRRETCTFDTIHTGRAIRAKLIKMFMTSMQLPHITWTLR